MMDLTEREEQEMIERAKAGDPEANYNMSLWALERAMAEPEEERWNRLAAKCLVRAAESGYAPARERMNELLRQSEPQPAPEPERPAQAQDREQPRPRPSVPTVVSATAAGLAQKVKGLFAKKERTGSAPETKHTAAKKVPFLNFSEWDDARWKKMQLVCIIICVVLAILIAVMLITRRDRGAEQEESQLPVATTAEPIISTPTPAPVLYPDEAIRAEIEAANLEIYPAPEDYVDEETTAVVSTSGSVLNLRRGPGSAYGQVASMDNGTSLEIFAYKNNWALARYNGDTWGWCSSDYLN